ncbi:MAG: S8 family peptidase [Nitrospira sp.]|nr:S8 family peptidase [Nitrospira sp.]
MPDKPILIFPAATVAARQVLSSAFPPPPPRRPTQAQQKRRLASRFQALSQSFGIVRADTAGLDPEQVVVFEVAGSVSDFQNVVRRIGGMEWLGDFEVDIAEPSPAFFEQSASVTPLPGRLFIVMSNQAKLTEIVQLWRIWCRSRDEKLPRNFGTLASIFKYLNDVRPWSVRDRLQERHTLEWWNECLAENRATIRFEVELWCRQSAGKRAEAYGRLQNVVREVRGQCITQSAIPEIDYHGVLVDLPASQVQATIDALNAGQDTKLLRLTDIKYFCSMGQVAIAHPAESVPGSFRQQPIPQGDPVVGLLDGLPLENHATLQDRLIIDDPDEFSTRYNAGEQRHGTAMASLIVHGELDANDGALQRPVYARPIMHPGRPDIYNIRWEQLPEGSLPVDLTFRAVRRIFEGDGVTPAVAPTVKAINFSIGDANQLFDREMSPWARLLDWLAWKYQVVFIVSAGNHYEDIALEVPAAQLATLSDENLRAQTFRAMARNRIERRLLAPSESINALTVGAVHADLGPNSPTPTIVDPLRNATYCSPISSVASGFRRSIKPDILVAGGRQHYVPQIMSGGSDPALLKIPQNQTQLGQQVAAPGGTAIPPNHTTRACGTSNATALTARRAAQLYEQINALRAEPGGDTLSDELISVLLKALLVHGASWSDLQSVIDAALNERDNGTARWNRVKRACAQFLGYGQADWVRGSVCTDQRVIMLGCGRLNTGEAHVYRVPLPSALSAQRVGRRMTISLAWLTPINTRHRSYRIADLWFDPPVEQLQLKRRDVDHNAATRGTVQHEILEGEQAVPIAQGDTAPIQVNCRLEAGSTLAESIPYGIAVTLETASPLAVSVYEQMKVALEGIREAARVRPIVRAGRANR